MLLTGHNPFRYIRESQGRGMDLFHDVHDWMGGYPYKSTTPGKVGEFLAERGFSRVKVIPWTVRLAGALGSGCSEYVFRRQKD